MTRKLLFTLSMAVTLAVSVEYPLAPVNTVATVNAAETSPYISDEELTAIRNADTAINELNSQIRGLWDSDTYEDYEKAADIWYEECKDTDLSDIVQVFRARVWILYCNEMIDILKEKYPDFSEFHEALEKRYDDYICLRQLPKIIEQINDKSETYAPLTYILDKYIRLDDEIKAMVLPETWDDFNPKFVSMFEKATEDEPGYDDVCDLLEAYVWATEISRNAVPDEYLEKVIAGAEEFGWDNILEDLNNATDSYGNKYDIDYEAVISELKKRLMDHSVLKNVCDQLDSLPGLEMISLDDENIIKTARVAYDSLNDLKCNIPWEKVLRLVEAEAKIVDLKLETDEGTAFRNPMIEEDLSMRAKKKVLYDCIWFGNYPQTEILESDEDITLNSAIMSNGDYEVDKDIFNALQKATGWTGTGDIIINGIKYRRLKSSEATYSKGTGKKEYYQWGSDLDTDNYHYFRYDPIKWRVLDVNGSTALLLADKALDCHQYERAVNYDVSWDLSSIRSFLNGYTSKYNQTSSDYSVYNFIDSAFSSEEQKNVKSTNLNNIRKLNYGKTLGENTTDKVYLLSDPDAFTINGMRYGFVEDKEVDDEARLCEASAYAKAMGSACFNSSIKTDFNHIISNKKTCYWWLDSLLSGSRTFSSYVNSYGDCTALFADCKFGVRPLLRLDLTSHYNFSYAGTVCSNGTVEEVNRAKRASIYSVINRLSIIASSKNVSLDDEDVICEARKAYDELGELQSMVPKDIYNTLEIAEKRILELKKQHEKDQSKQPILVSKINLSGISNNIVAGKSIQLTATILPKNTENKKLKWTSSNTKVATVTQNGKVTIKKGTGGKNVTITTTATDGSGKKALFKIKVMKGAVKSIKIKGAKKTLKVGKTMKLKTIVKVTKGKPVNKKVKWTSSNTKFATVSSNGVVKALKAGKGKKVKITAMATDGTGKKKTITIKIK